MTRLLRDVVEIVVVPSAIAIGLGLLLVGLAPLALKANLTPERPIEF